MKISLAVLPFLFIAACSAETTSSAPTQDSRVSGRTFCTAGGDGVADDLGTTVDANGDLVPDKETRFMNGQQVEITHVDTNYDGVRDADGLALSNDCIVDAIDSDLDGSFDKQSTDGVDEIDGRVWGL